MALSDAASAKATQLLLDAVAVIIADDPDLVATPVKAIMVYEFLRENGEGQINVFGTDGIWSAEAIGLLELGKHDLLIEATD